MSVPEHFDPEPILRGLKGFQRRTVDYAFRRLWLDDQPAHRFLVADEVGLGKTLVARGVIARTIAHLQAQQVERIDVVYICSNADIARQNVARLAVTGAQDFVRATRITLLPKLVSDLRKQRINFVSFTPGTSFEMGTRRMGNGEERVLLYRLLENAWKLDGKSGSLNAFRGNIRDPKTFLRQIEQEDNEPLDKALQRDFVSAVGKRPELRRQFKRIAAAMPRSDSRMSDEIRAERRQLIGGLRRELAHVCIAALQPDLIILDEFQRFKHLLTSSDDEGDELSAGELARTLFDYHSAELGGKARVLLLSATPYKLYSQAGDADGDDHYEDFVATYRFLADEVSGDAADTGVIATPSADALRSALADYRSALLSTGTPDARDWRPARDRVQSLLRRVMARTERLAASADRNGMLQEVSCADIELQPEDILAHLETQQLARAVGHPDITEYWKSAPYVASFGKGYKLLEHGREDGEDALSVLERAEHLHVPKGTRRGSSPVLPPHPRLRWLLRNVERDGLFDLLWLPPSLPYYRLAGSFAGREGTGTKRLVFSAWQMVPRALAALVTLEAERRHFGDRAAGNLERAVQRASEPLVFSMRDRRPSRMSLLSLLYPSFTLAEHGDPLRAAAEKTSVRSLEQVRARLEGTMAELLRPLTAAAPTRGVPDQRWYWAAPALLDRVRDPAAFDAWVSRSGAEAPFIRWIAESDREELDLTRTGAGRHFAEFREVVESGTTDLGPPPGDLPSVLAAIALGSPAVCALRALSRGAPDEALRRVPARDAASRIAQGFRSYFNLPAVVAAMRHTDDEAYWQSVLVHAADGCLQAVLDEWLHVLPDQVGVGDRRHDDDALLEIADEAHKVLGLRTAQVRTNRKPTRGEPATEDDRFRARFAVRFGDQGSDGDEDVRGSTVRSAFNAPFWPFVLATTSVGQEGLDFHTYCHAVVHWNLPYNPVDMEQREGRVHRFKGHAVRKNAAARYGPAAVASGDSDPWAAVFDLAARAHADESDVVPYWVLSSESGAKIERHVPNLPLSRDLASLERLRRDLGLYRMVFGQPRQDELLQALAGRLDEPLLSDTVTSARIDLVPPIDTAIRAASSVQVTERQRTHGLRPEYADIRFLLEAGTKLPDAFAIISAYATTGETWSDERNRLADEALARHLDQVATWRVRMTGYSPSSGHAEPSWAVAIDMESARVIGQRFLQEAIWYVRHDVLLLVPCDIARRQLEIGAFLERLDRANSGVA